MDLAERLFIATARIRETLETVILANDIKFERLCDVFMPYVLLIIVFCVVKRFTLYSMLWTYCLRMSLAC